MVEPGLLKDERLLWTARPRPGLFFRLWWFAVIPLLSVGCWISGTVVWSSLRSPESPPFVFFSLAPVVFVVVIVAYLVGLDLLARLRAEYHLTDKRVIVVSRIIISLERSLPLTEIGEVALREKPDGSGTVTFRPKESWVYRSRPPAYLDLLWFPRLAFEDIVNARQAYNLVLEARLAQTQQSRPAA